jgi:outer membrane protein assembly factor BamB
LAAIAIAVVTRSRAAPQRATASDDDGSTVVHDERRIDDAVTVLMRPLLFDVDADGVQDLIGVFGHVPAMDRSFEARSGKDGHELWRSPASSPGIAPAPSIYALIGDVLVVADDTGLLTAVDPHSGNTLWTRTLNTPIRDVCAGQDDVGALVDHEEPRRYAIATGLPLPRLRTPCDRTYTSKSDAPNFTVVEGDALNDISGIRATTMTVRRALVPTSGTARVLLGFDGASPSVGTVGVISKGNLLWQASLAATAPADSTLLSSATAAVRRERVVVLFTTGNPASLHMACFALVTGRRSWDVVLPNADGASAEVILSQDGQIFYREGSNHLRVFALENGAERWTMGRP